MQAHINLMIGPVEESQVEKNHKSHRLFSRINKFIAKSVSYYQDEDLKKMGAPFIWTE